ncbi:MAG: glycoside hydrolase family 16 protein [Bacteroides sp.]|nr:glycoside hydrolase family 16 protein [Bacteroides sp.]
MRTIQCWVILLLLAAGCTSAPEKKSVIETESGLWELVWSDEFDYTGLPNSTRWSFNTERNKWAWGNQELQWYTDRKQENAWVENGVLTITARKEDLHGKEYTSARLRTKGKGDWKYCRVEVKAQLPAGRGVWSAIWMLPTDVVYGEWPYSGEIDIMEHVGYTPDSVFFTVHTLHYNHLEGTQVSGTLFDTTLTKEFHVYALEWEEEELRSYVDDRLYFTFRKNDAGFEAWPFNQSFHLLLNLAIGGNLGGIEGVDNSLFPQHYVIEYVRVYKKREA